MRYNMFQEKGDWFPGCFATPDKVAQVDQSVSSVDLDVKAMLTETHDEFFKPKEES